MSDKTMYTPTEIQEVAKRRTAGNMQLLYRESAHRLQIQKADEPEIQKSEGEGSKGGKVIGHTESGKPVYESHSTGHKAYKGFTHEDHADASEIHSKLADHYNEKRKEHSDHERKLDKYTGEKDPEGYTKMQREAQENHGWEQHHGYLAQKHWDKVGKDLRGKIRDAERLAKEKSDKDKEIKKAEEPELQKSEGEGSKGGKVIGHTTSGKPVYAKHGADHESYKDFTPKEHHEAAAHHNTEQMTVLEGGKSKHGPKGQAHHEAMEVAHNKMATQKKKEAAKKKEDESKENDFHHHRKLAGFHEGMEEKYADQQIDLKSSSDKDLHKFADDLEPKRSKHAQLAAKHDKKARELHDIKKHGSWNSTIPKHDEAMEYGRSNYKDDEIKKAEETIIGYYLEQMIEKGEISDALGRGYGPASEAIKFTKTGKEIKAAIPGILTSLTLESGKVAGQMEEIAKEIGIDPKIPRTSYFVKNIACLSYDYDLCSPLYDKVNQCYPEPSVQNQLCSKYNSLGYLQISLAEDIATLTVMQSNLEDGKKYTLSVSQLIALGF